MALVICPECGKQISDKATVCPNCGAPLSEMFGTLSITRESSAFENNSPLRIILDEGNADFEINRDETYEVKVPFGTRKITVLNGDEQLFSTMIEMKEDYFFVFTDDDINSLTVLDSAGLSVRKAVEDVGAANTTKLICPKCHSVHVNVQMVTEQKLVKKRHSIAYWVFIGWWWNPIIWFIKWFFFTIPALIFALFHIGGKKRELVTTHKTMAVCQDCGFSWEIKT